VPRPELLWGAAAAGFGGVMGFLTSLG